MTHARNVIVIAVLSAGLLTGCGASSEGSTPTDEAIVGGIETVAPEAEGLTALGVVDAIEGAGGYDCSEDGSGWACTAVDGSGGSITVAGAAEEEPTVTGRAPIDAATVEAVAATLGASAAEIYSADAGLAWPVQ